MACYYCPIALIIILSGDSVSHANMGEIDIVLVMEAIMRNMMSGSVILLISVWLVMVTGLG